MVTVGSCSSPLRATRSLHTLKIEMLLLLLPCSTVFAGEVVASTPPLGYNSYDSYDWTMDEAALFSTAQAMQDKLGKTWKISSTEAASTPRVSITLDWYWYRDGRQINRTLPKTGLPTNQSCQIFFDSYGRMYPDPYRFLIPSFTHLPPAFLFLYLRRYIVLGGSYWWVGPYTFAPSSPSLPPSLPL